MSSSSVTTPNIAAVAAVAAAVAPVSSSSSSSLSTTKENNGESAKKRRLKRIFLWTATAIIVYAVIQKIYYKHFADQLFTNNNNYSYSEKFDKVLINKRPERHYKDNNYIMDGKGEVINLKTKKERMDAILEGYLTLVDISIRSLAGSNNNGNNNNKYIASGIFCKIDWINQQNNVSTVAMFRDLKTKSIMCDATTISVDLYDIVNAAKKYDIESNNIHGGSAVSGSAVSGSGSGVSVISKPNGIIFHETRCGSTLFANILASININSRVYSESPPPVTALKACGDTTSSSKSNNCNPEIHKQLIRDVFYMMGRSRITNNNENNNKDQNPHHAFYKIQSIGVMSIDKFTMAFPDVPWVYVYRDSVEIMQSHMKNGIENIISGGRGRGRTSSSNSNPPVCGRNYRLPYNKQPSTTLEIIQNSLKGVTGREYSSTIQKDLNIIEYCAAHIAGLSLSAIKEYYRHSDGGGGVGGVGGGDSSQEGGQKDKRTSTSTSTSTNGTNSMGRFVNYSDMPEIVWNDIIPNHFNIDITNKNVYRSAMKNMENTALVYSKGGRGSKKANMEFKEDSTKKQSTAPQEVIDAVELFTVDTYNTMKSISYNHNHKL